ncbi:unnamed protein product [Aphanomyces euteiches]
MRSLVALAAPLSTRKKYRNNVFSSSDEEDRPRTSVYRKGQSEEQPSRRGLFDEDTDDNVEEQIKERQMQKKAQWDSLQAKLNEAMQTVETHKNDMLQVTNQLSAAIAKVEKRNRQLHNAKSLVQSLQQSLAQLQTQLDEEKQTRSREKEEWATEKAALQQEIDELQSGTVSPPVNPPVSPTTLLGKIWSKKKESPPAPSIAPTTTSSSQRPPMFTVPIISSDSIAGSDDDSPSEEEPPKMQPEEPVVVDQKAIPIGVSRMNFYMEERMKKEAEKRQKELKEQQEKNKLQEDFENEWAALAQETKELKKNKKLKKPTKANTRIARQRPSSFKQVPGTPAPSVTPTPVVEKPTPPPATPPATPVVSTPKEPIVDSTPKPPLPPEPSEAEMELYRRQQARLHELHESERQKREKAEEADILRRQLHGTVAQWAQNKPLVGLLTTLDQLVVIQGIVDPTAFAVSNDAESIKKGYRNLIRIIHPDKLRNATIQQQLVAKEVFTVVNQAFEAFKLSTS